METARTYVFLFVPIPTSWLFHESMIRGCAGGSNGSSSTDQKGNESSRSLVVRRCECEVEVLPSQLSWTWFVDNPRPSWNSYD